MWPGGVDLGPWGSVHSVQEWGMLHCKELCWEGGPFLYSFLEWSSEPFPSCGHDKACGWWGAAIPGEP